MALVLKTSERKLSEVRILYPPLSPRRSVSEGGLNLKHYYSLKVHLDCIGEVTAR